MITEKWKHAVDKGECFGVLLTDLPKAFDCLSHELLIGRLHTYSFDLQALKRTKVTYETKNKEQNQFNV